MGANVADFTGRCSLRRILLLRDRAGLRNGGGQERLDLAEEARRLLLLSYLGRTPRDEETERLEHLAWLYDYVCVLWSELFAARGDGEARAVSARARFLAERLYAERL